MSSKNLKKSFSLAQNLKKLKNLNTLTSSQLAKALELQLPVIKGYEFNKKIPPIPSLIKLAKYFSVSIDFIILGNDTPYTRNIKLFELANKIDHFDMNERYKVEGSASALIGKVNTEVIFKNDDPHTNLTISFHQNLKILRKENNLTQLELAQKIGTKRLQVALYEKKAFPRIEKLLNLSKVLNVSIHALLTGQKLTYYFQNKGLQKTMLRVDHLLPLKDQQFLIHLMERIIEDTEQ